MAAITGIREAGTSFFRCGMSSVVHPAPHHSLVSFHSQCFLGERIIIIIIIIAILQMTRLRLKEVKSLPEVF